MGFTDQQAALAGLVSCILVAFFYAHSFNEVEDALLLVDASFHKRLMKELAIPGEVET